MGAEHDDGKRGAAHDHAQGLEAVHARHFEIEGDHVGMEFFNLAKGERAIHGGANDLDVRIALEDQGNQLPHERGIVDDQYSHAVFHAMAPRGRDRDRRERIAGTLRIRTTVPSPRMEAPLTRSLVTISPGNALITSSSSPTRLSTTSPKRFSAIPMTTTKFFVFLEFAASTGWMRLIWFKRTRVRICSRRRSTSR